jgi:hypothetical protein
MDPATIVTLLGLADNLIQDVPEAVAAWNSIKTAITSGTEPTSNAWTTVMAQMDAAHAAMQAANAPDPTI